VRIPPGLNHQETTMLIQTRNTTFDLHFRGLYISIGQYEFSLDRNGYCLCKGMKTIWSNWE
jgi:hypothetical protein